MSIFPKKKFQSGGSLETAYNYPTIGYQPVSQMPLSAGLFTPIQKKLSKDAELDPEILKKVDGLTLQTDNWYNNYANDVNTYNNLSEAERMTTRGTSLLNKVRSVGSDLNRLKQGKAVWETANAEVKANEAYTNLGVEDGNIVVNENGKLSTEPINDVLTKITLGVGNKQLLPLKDLSSYRDLNQDVDETYVNVAGKSLGGTKVAEALRPTFDKAGISETATKFESEYLNRPDGFLKSVLSGDKTSTNFTQLTTGIDAVYNGLASNVKNGIESKFVTDFLINSDRDIYSWKVPSGNSPAGVLGKASTLSSEKTRLMNALDSDRKTIGDDKALDNYRNGIETLKNKYVKSYIMGIAAPYINPSEEHTGEYKKATGAEGDIGSESYVPKKATLNVAYHQGLFNSFGKIDSKVVTTAGDKAVEFSTKTYTFDTKQDEGQNIKAVMIEEGGSKSQKNILDKTIKNDEVIIDYVVNGSVTVGGRSEEDIDSESIVLRAGVPSQVITLYHKDTYGRITPLKSTDYVTGGGKKVHEVISTEKTKIYGDLDAKLKKENPTPEKAQELTKDAQKKYEEVLRKYKIVQVKAARAPGLILIPEGKEDEFRKNSVSFTDYELLDDATKILLKNTVSSLVAKGERSLSNWYLSDSKTVVEYNGKKYIPKVVTIRGIMKDNAEILAADTKRGLNKEIEVLGDPNAPSEAAYGQIDYITNLNPYQFTKKEEGGLIPQFTPRTFNFKPLTLNELY